VAVWLGEVVAEADTVPVVVGDSLDRSSPDEKARRKPYRLVEASVVKVATTAEPGTVEMYGPGRLRLRSPDRYTVDDTPRFNCRVS
jgi:hypothetical protein